MRYLFPYVGADLRKPVLQPGISQHCETTVTGWCITQYACLLPSFRRVSQPQRADSGLQWVPGSAPRWITRPKMVTHQDTN